MANQLLEHDLDRVESQYAIDLNRGHQKDLVADDTYYPQIEQEVRREAAQMAPHYEVFYSLEKTIRSVISDTLETSVGQGWWDDQNAVPPTIKAAAEAARQREVDSGTTPRSSDPLDYTTFGELTEIIKLNWSTFAGMFKSLRAVERVMSNLNTLRAPIAHCSPLAEDEVLRLKLSVRDWFRLME